jgi:hypothetical protein
MMKTFPFHRIYHNHFLSKEWLEQRLPGTPFTRNIHLARQTLSAIETLKQKVHYICIMRDPIARDLSNVIQNHVETEIDIYGSSLDSVIAQVRGKGHMFFQEWFDTDFSVYFGKPLSSFGFDPAKGYAIHQVDERRQLLLLVVESMDRVFEEALSEFLGTDIDPQFRFNESNNKSEAGFYTKLKSVYCLPTNEIDVIYTASAVKHFYSDTEVSALKKKWEIKCPPI